MIRVNPDVKFSYDLVKGSPQSRREFVGNLNAKIFESIQSSMHEGGILLDDYKRIFKSVCPENKKVTISKISPKDKIFEGSTDYIYDNKNNIVGQSMELPTQKGKIQTKELVTVMHEGTHAIEVLSNPKYTVRRNKLYKNGMYGDVSNKWYDTVLYRKEDSSTEYEKRACLDDVKERTSKFLSGKSKADKLDYIQDARYELEQEKNAYEEQLKYAKLLEFQGKEVDPDDLKDGNKTFLFPEKIEMLKQMGFEVVAEIRKKLAKSH